MSSSLEREVASSRDYAIMRERAEKAEAWQESLMAQHARDSAELRRLCQARDDFKKERDAARAELEKVKSALIESMEQTTAWKFAAEKVGQDMRAVSVENTTLRAELEAERRRVAEAPIVTVVDHGHAVGIGASPVALNEMRQLGGKQVRLVLEDGGDAETIRRADR